MSLYDTFGEYQVKIFHYASCPLVRKSNRFDDVVFEPTTVNGVFECFNKGDDVPYKDYHYNYGKNFLVFDYRCSSEFDVEPVHIIKDGKYRKSISHKYINNIELALVIDNYGQQLNIKTESNFNDIVEEYIYYMTTYHELKKKYELEAGITKPINIGTLKEVGQEKFDILVKAMGEASDKAYNESLKIFHNKWYTKETDDNYVQLFDDTAVGYVLAECLHKEIHDWEKYMTVKSFLEYIKTKKENLHDLVRNYLEWNQEISEKEVIDVFNKYNRDVPANVVKEYKASKPFRVRKSQ